MTNLDIFNFCFGMFFIVIGLGYIVYGLWEMCSNKEEENERNGQ